MTVKGGKRQLMTVQNSGLSILLQHVLVLEFQIPNIANASTGTDAIPLAKLLYLKKAVPFQR